jgi:quercetin dioxygenase-like cupin family protein
MLPSKLSEFPIHLGVGATAVIQPRFTGTMDWYSAYEQRIAADGVEGRLVSLHSFSEPWDAWEMHPHGSEVVVCLSGSITLHQQREDGEVLTTTLNPGEYAINDPGIWHTADVDSESTALFITAGAGTQHRKR